MGTRSSNWSLPGLPSHDEHQPTQRERETACQALVDGYHGELAAGHGWPWLQPLREALRRDVLDAYHHLAATAAPDQAAQLLQRAAAADRYNACLTHRGSRPLEADVDHDTPS